MGLRGLGAEGGLGGLGSLRGWVGISSLRGRVGEARDSNGRAWERSSMPARPSEVVAKGLTWAKSLTLKFRETGSEGTGMAVRGGRDGRLVEAF